MADIWPIDWPISVDITSYDPYHIQRAEEAAGKVLRTLTLYRVGGLPITVMPVNHHCCHPFTGGQFGNSYLPFYPVLLESGQYSNCFCGSGCGCEPESVVYLKAPVGRIDRITIDGVDLPNTAYRVEDGYKLRRLDGSNWPSCAGDKFTVTYLNAYEVDVYGQFVGGLLANEFLQIIADPGADCRLPIGVTSVARQGINIEISQGLFPDGVTNIPEVDLYLKQWNPYQMKSAPQVYSPDMPVPREITWEA
jgi:hypothetical protein